MTYNASRKLRERAESRRHGEANAAPAAAGGTALEATAGEDSLLRQMKETARTKGRNKKGFREGQGIGGRHAR